MISRWGWKLAGALLGYAKLTQGQSIAHIRSMQVYSADAYVRMDAATRRNLEITQTLRGEPAPTLLSLLDTCATNMGSRLLTGCTIRWCDPACSYGRARITPLSPRGEGLRAGNNVETTVERSPTLTLPRGRGITSHHPDYLSPCVDVERITARIALRSARPRDLRLRDTPLTLPQLLKPHL